MQISLFERPRVNRETKRTRQPGRRLVVECLEDRCSPGVIIDLGTLGGYNSHAWGINNSGIVIGDAYTFMFFNDHAFTYNANGTSTGPLTDMGTLNGGVGFSQALGINDAGQIVGGATNTSGNTHAFLFSPANPTLNISSTMTDLGTLGGSSSMATAIDSLALVAGYSTTSGGQNHAFLYNGLGMTDLGTLGGPTSWANAVNDSGIVVGASLTSLYQQHAFVSNRGVITDLGTLGGFVSEAFAINNAGQVVGEAMTASYQVHAFLFTPGRSDITPPTSSTMTDLGTFGGWGSYAYGINNLGQVVGTSQTSAGAWHAFLYSGGVMTDLNSKLPANSGWIALSQANSINNNGQIVGTGFTATGFSHGFVLNL